MTTYHRNMSPALWEEYLDTLPIYMQPCRPKLWERNKAIYIAWMSGKFHKQIAKEHGISYVRIHHIVKELQYQLSRWANKQIT